MDIRQLAYFLAIAEEKNISRAAEKLHIAQPPLSQQLKLLEDELGVKLVERSTRKFEVTDAGKALHNKAKQILDLVDTTVKEIKDINKGLQGIITIGSIGSVGSTILPKIIAEFHEIYPGINFHMIDEDTEKTIELLYSGVIDIGIVRTPINKEHFEYIDLKDDTIIAIGGNVEWKNKKKAINIDELEGVPLIVQRRYEKQIIDLCHEAGFEPTIVCRSNDVRTIILWANEGIGVAIVPKICSTLIDNKKMFFRDIEEPFLKVGSAVVWLKKKYLRSSTKYFIDSMRTYLEENKL